MGDNADRINDEMPDDLDYYRVCAIPKPQPRCVEKKRKQKLDAKDERALVSPYRCSKNHLKREHTVIAEKALGHELPPKARVYHVNGDGRDNRNRNLVICQDDGYHQLLHIHQRVKLAGGESV